MASVTALSGTLVNPVREHRVDLNMTIEALSSKIEVNLQTLYLTERGCYAQIPPVISEFFESEFGFNSFHLEKAYLEFVKNTREMFRIDYARELNEVSFESVREIYEHLEMSRTYFAKAICVQPAILYKLESGRQKSLPAQLKEALLALGFRQEEIERLRNV